MRAGDPGGRRGLEGGELVVEREFDTVHGCTEFGHGADGGLVERAHLVDHLLLVPADRDHRPRRALDLEGAAELAQDLGARPMQVFFLVTLPMIAQSMLAAWLLHRQSYRPIA